MSYVTVFGYPYEAPNGGIKTALSSFGDVEEVRYQRWTNLPNISTATRIFRINCKKPIPGFFSISGVRVKFGTGASPPLATFAAKRAILVVTARTRVNALNAKASTIWIVIVPGSVMSVVAGPVLPEIVLIITLLGLIE